MIEENNEITSEKAALDVANTFVQKDNYYNVIRWLSKSTSPGNINTS